MLNQLRAKHFSFVGVLVVSTTTIVAIRPVQAESINIQFTGVVEERVSVDISPPQPLEIEIAANSSTGLIIPELTYTQTLNVNSSQPVSVVITSDQVTTTQVSHPSTGTVNVQLPLTKSNSELFTVTIVPN